jgi:thymidylate synthase
MGINYGVLWRKWPAYYYSCQVDQLREVVDRIKTNPTDRRLVVTAWHPEFIKDTCLPPCHYAYQFYVASNAYGTYLDCIVHMRSVDCFLGLPFDIASYALLMHIVAQETKLKPCKLIMTLGDTHIYKGHTAQVKEQINRIPYALPKLILQEEATIDNFAGSMAALANYTHHSAIKGDLYVG